MATALENARTRVESILAELAAATNSQTGIGKPTAGAQDSPRWIEHRDGLLRELKALLELFPTLAAEFDTSTVPAMTLQQGVT